MKKAVFFLLFCFFASLAFGQESKRFHIDSLPPQGILLDKNWKFQLGDNPDFAKTDFDDSKWESIDPTKDIFDLPQIPKDGKIVWFRLRFSLDDTTNQQLALLIQQAGASEIYLNGKLIKIVGLFSTNPTQIKAYNPLGKPIFFTSIKDSVQILAIRYALQPHISYFKNRQRTNVGFKSYLSTAEEAIDILDILYHAQNYDDLLRMGVFGILSVLFFTLYVFYPSHKASLYFSIYTLSMALAWVIQLKFIVPSFVEHWHFYYNLMLALRVVAYLLMLTSVYTILGYKKNWIYWFFVALSVFCIIASHFIYFWGSFISTTIFNNLIALEVTRVAFIALRNKKKGSLIIMVSSICYFVCWFIYTLGIQKVISMYVKIPFFDIALLSIPAGFSIFLGYDFALTNRLLEKKLVEIETLSSEKQQILENQKDELEKQVVERTLQLKETNEELHSTNEELHKKNEDITASITYAKRIQTAMLPRIDDIQKALPESFILFKPRDIVSGDFYYFKEIVAPPPAPSPKERGIDSLPEGNPSPLERVGVRQIILACADCTGHGVPGAFMSMIGNEILTNIVEIQGITSPDLILNELHKNIRAALKQGETENRDGMDISIVMIDKEKQILEYAGAMNPIYYVEYDFPNRTVANSDLESRTPVLKEIKADKLPIGGSQKEQERTFTKHTIELGVRSYELGVEKEQLQTPNPKPQTVFYLCSDGFQDQFGGAQGKKFMVKKFRELLFSIHHLPMHEQRQILDDTIESWMAEGNEKQIDDILVMGVKI